jgi:hypothetical protein
VADNNFPRGSREPTQAPESQNKNASENKPGDSVLEGYGSGGGHGPTLRDMEANTADGRGSRTPEFTPTGRQSGDVGQDVSGNDVALITDVAPYGGQPVGTNSQGGMPRDLPGGPEGLDFDS